MYLEDAIEEFLLDCQIRKLSKRTVQNYGVLLNLMSHYLHDKLSVITLEEVKPIHVKRFIQLQEERGRKPQYINDLLKAFRVFFKYCESEEYITEIPTARIRNVKQPKTLIRGFDEKEIADMLTYYNGPDYQSMRNKTMLALMFDTGIRLNEMLTLRPEQIMKDRILIHGKGNKERYVPISPYLAKQLVRYRAARISFFEANVHAENYYFLSYRGNKLTGEVVRKMMIEAAEAVGVRKDIRVSPHTCRHTFAHLQLKNGLDIYSLSRLLGHESIAITQRYLDGIRTEEILDKAKGTGVLEHL